MDPSHYQIIIIGSGPAGISTALHLQKLSPDLTGKILIIEKATHPREKICGGALTGNASKILRELNIKLNIPKVKIKKVRFAYCGESITLPETNDTFVIRRNEFDRVLSEKAIEQGLRINQEEKLTEIKRNPGDLNITTTKCSYDCDILVAADGAKSSVRKILKFRDTKLSPLLLTEVPVKKEDRAEFKENLISFDFTLIPNGLAGYIWSFPFISDNSENLSIGIYHWNKKNLRNLNLKYSLNEFLSKNGFEAGSVQIKASAERYFAIDDEISKPNVILAGESAGIDPLLGEGISQSLGYGKFAAGEIVKALSVRDFSFRNYKKNLLGTELGKELKDLASYANYLYNGNYRFWLSLIFYNRNLRNFIRSNSFKGYGNFNKHRLRFFIIALMHKLWGKKNLG